MVFLIILALTAKPVAADTVSNESTVDFVLVVDCSGSMSINDPNGLTAEAAKMFINKLPTDKVRLSIVAMGDDYKRKKRIQSDRPTRTAQDVFRKCSRYRTSLTRQQRIRHPLL